jgi:hypothetical protein
MNRKLLMLCVLALVGCSKKKDGASAEGSGAAPAGSGTAATKPITPDPAPPPAKAAPTLTHAEVVAVEPKWTIEAIDRGLWFSENGGPLEQKCRVELGMAMGKMGKYRGAAEKAGAAATTCTAKGVYTACTFKNPDAAAAENEATWIFGNDDNSADVVLIAVLLGPAGDWAAIEPQLGTIKECPRPSQDPQ